MRKIFLDTETTGLDCKSGHRIIEFGAVEMIDRKLTGKNLHFYFKPDIKVEAAALKVHGLTNDFLADKPYFREKIDEIMNYLKNAEIIIHNAGFDVSFLNCELQILPSNNWGNIEKHCKVTDSLIMARKKHPAQKNSLDALCSRYGINNKHRIFHGALLDAELLSEVYLAMTGGQMELFNSATISGNQEGRSNVVNSHESINFTSEKFKLINLLSLYPQNEDHKKYLEILDESSKGKVLWNLL